MKGGAVGTRLQIDLTARRAFVDEDWEGGAYREPFVVARFFESGVGCLCTYQEEKK